MEMKEEIELREDRKRWRENAILNEIERLKKNKGKLDRRIRRRTVFLSSLVLFLLMCIYLLLSRETNSMAQNRNLAMIESSYPETTENIYALAVKKSYPIMPENIYSLQVKNDYPESTEISDTVSAQKSYPETKDISDTLSLQKDYPEKKEISDTHAVSYRIQIGAFSKRSSSFESRLDTFEIKWVNEDGLVKYYLGNYESIEYATDLINKLSGRGFQDVFIYPVKEEKKITWREHNRIRRHQNRVLHFR